MIRVVALLLLLTSIGCTDAEWSSLGSLGDKSTVELYSGGKLVRSWTSTGKVISENDGDGHSFKDASTGAYVRVNGDVVITCK